MNGTAPPEPSCERSARAGDVGSRALGGWRGSSRRSGGRGGSGVVPLMAMLRLARRTGRDDLVRLVVSVRDPGELLYADELPGPEATIVYSRATPDAWPRPAGRLAAADLEPLLRPDATAYVCGSARFAEAASALLVGVGVAPEQIRVERFGPTG